MQEVRKRLTLTVFGSREIYDYLRNLLDLDIKFVSDFDPHFSLPAVKVDCSEIYFHAKPKLQNLTHALRVVDEGVKSGKDVLVLTFISPTCPNCSAVVDSINSLAKKFAIEHHIFDVAMLPEIAERYNVMSVPTVFIGEMRFVGAIKAEKWIEDAIRGEYGDYFSEKLKRGEIEDVLELVRKKGLGMALGKLIGHEDFMVRLGAMAAAEALANDRNVAEGILKAVRELLHHKDVRIREDAAMMLGLLGGEEDIKILEKLIPEGGSVGESAMEALEEIRVRMRRGKNG